MGASPTFQKPVKSLVATPTLGWAPSRAADLCAFSETLTNSARAGAVILSSEKKKPGFGDTYYLTQ